MTPVEEQNDTDWRTFQDEVAGLFNKIPGCVARVNHPVRGARIGTVHVDVLVTFRPPRNQGFQPRGRERDHGFGFTVIVECKFWRRPIPQEKVFALKTIVEDVGAAMGILVSEVGLQCGAVEYLAHPVNVIAVTFSQLQSISSGFPFGKCTACGNVALFPFPPDPDHPAYCSDCYSKLKESF